MDLALLPHARRAGTGTIALSRVLEEARRTGLPVTIHVERFNRALSFYERLGFRLREDRGVYLFLEWRPEADAGAEASCSTG